MKSFLPKTTEIKRNWHELDASEQPLGRLATRAAVLLRGKHKTSFSPHQDGGDFVVVKNADKLKVTGRKLIQKKYFRFSGYLGGIKSRTLSEQLEKDPGKVIHEAVRLMLPANRLRKNMLKRLKIVKGEKHNFKIN